MRQSELHTLRGVGIVQVRTDGEISHGPLVFGHSEHAMHVLRNETTHGTRADALLGAGSDSDSQSDVRLVGGPGEELVRGHRGERRAHRLGVVRRLFVHLAGLEEALNGLGGILSRTEDKQMRTFRDL